ncbi:MAG TPA: TolC family protein, partial [Pontibacter sp.]
LDPLWYVGVGVRWNIFDGLAAANRAQQTKLDREVMEHRKREAQELLQLNLQKVQAEASKNLQLVHVAEQQVQTARRVLDTSQKQYELGLISLRDHLGSLTDMQTAQLEQLTAIYRQRLSILDLLEATGSLTPENIPAH